MRTLALAIGSIGFGAVSAVDVSWTARGEVRTITGGAFSETGVKIGDPIDIELIYDSSIPVDGRSYLPVEGSIAGRGWFHGAAGLRITLKSKALTWSGEMAVVPVETDVMESVCWDYGGKPDWFKVTLDAARGGEFPSFPHLGEESSRALGLEFRDDTAPAELFDVQILPDSLTRLCQMTSASGAISAGESTIAFSIDPESVRIQLPLVPVSISKFEEQIELSWETELGKTYRIEGSSDFRCWTKEGRYPGTGGSRKEQFEDFEIHPTRFFRVVEL